MRTKYRRTTLSSGCSFTPASGWASTAESPLVCSGSVVDGCVHGMHACAAKRHVGCCAEFQHSAAHAWPNTIPIVLLHQHAKRAVLCIPAPEPRWSLLSKLQIVHRRKPGAGTRCVRPDWLARKEQQLLP